MSFSQVVKFGLKGENKCRRQREWCEFVCVLVVSLQELSANQELSIPNNLIEVSLICVEVLKKKNNRTKWKHTP